MSQYSNAGQTNNLYTNIGLHTNQVHTNCVTFGNRNVEFSRQILLFIPMNSHLLGIQEGLGNVHYNESA